MGLLRFLGNVIWLLIAGLWLAIGYALGGVIACLLIITIPFGIASFRLALYTLWPFGRVVVPAYDQPQALGILGNIVWIIFGGFHLAVAHLVAGAVLCLTIVGIPLGVACFKLIPLALVPFGKTIVPVEALPPDAGLAAYGAGFSL